MKKISIILVFIITFLAGSFNVSANSAQFSTEEAIIEVIEAYYAESFASWTDLNYPTYSNILNMSSIQNQNKLELMKEEIDNWTYRVNRGYIQSSNVREIGEYDINYTEFNIDDNTASVEAIITLSSDCAYPFFISGGTNTFYLVKIDNQWLINEHQYDDPIFAPPSSTHVYSYDVEELYENIDLFYTDSSAEVLDTYVDEPVSPAAYPYDSYSYSSVRATMYANAFAAGSNTSLFKEYTGQDCTNFVSQCVSYGFGPSSSTGYYTYSSYRMVGRNANPYSILVGWNADTGRASNSWVNVESFWDYITRSTADDGPRASVISITNVTGGDIVQLDTDSNTVYNHSIICVDPDTLMFAQHSDSSAFRYLNLNDGVPKRCCRPTTYRQY